MFLDHGWSWCGKSWLILVDLGCPWWILIDHGLYWLISVDFLIFLKSWLISKCSLNTSSGQALLKIYSNMTYKRTPFADSGCNWLILVTPGWRLLILEDLCKSSFSFMYLVLCWLNLDLGWSWSWYWLITKDSPRDLSAEGLSKNKCHFGC